MPRRPTSPQWPPAAAELSTNDPLPPSLVGLAVDLHLLATSADRAWLLLCSLFLAVASLLLSTKLLLAFTAGGCEFETLDSRLDLYLLSEKHLTA